MSLKAEWANPEKTVILQTLEGQWTLTDLFALMEAEEKMLLEVDHKVDFIADLTHARFSKDNLFPALGRIQRSSKLPNSGRIAVLNANGYIRSLVNVVAKVAPQATTNIFFVNTMEEAYTRFKEPVATK